MKAPAIPNDELERFASLQRLQVLDTPPEARFDRITLVAQRMFKVPISTITLVDSNREWYKSCRGVKEHEQVRTISFCAHAMLSKDDVFIVNDTLEDTNFADNPMVTNPPYIRFYAGVPIFSIDEKRIGAFCIKDTKPRKLSESESYLLRVLASWAEIELNINELVRILKDYKENKLTEPDKAKINIVLQRLSNRDVIDRLKSLKVGIRMTINEDDRLKYDINEEAIDQILQLIFELQKI